MYAERCDLKVLGHNMGKEKEKEKMLENHVGKVWKHCFILSLVGLSVWLMGEWDQTRSVEMLWKRWTSRCDLGEFHEFNPNTPYLTSLMVCEESDKSRIQSLYNHMQLYSGEQDATSASQFGVYYKIGYVKNGKRLLINPRVVKEGEAMTFCLIRDNDKVVHYFVSKQIIVEYKDYNMELQRVVFENEMACLVHKLIESL